MSLWLRQSTAVTLKIGPFLDSTDGVTPETGLSIGQNDVLLSKNGGAFAAKNDTNACTHDADGWYSCSLDATDTNTLGRLQLSVQVSGAIPVWHEFTVVPANVYDSLIAGSDKLEIDTVQWNGTAVSTGGSSGLPAVDAQAISDSTTAADNVESNITNLDEPSSTILDAVFNIGIAAAGVAEVATGATITTGTETGDYEDTYALDETYHVITADGGVIDMYYEFTLDDDAVPVDMHVKGRLHEGSTPSGGDSVDIYVYDWTNSSWEQMVPPLGGFVGVANSDSSDDEVRIVPLFARHKDSSTNKVRIRFYSTSLETGTALYIDQIYMTQTAVLSYNGIADSILRTPANKLATDSDGYVTVATNNDKDGYSLAADQSGVTIGTVNTVTNGVTVAANNDKTDYQLAADQAVNVTKWAGTTVSVGATSNLPVVDAQAISDATSAADNLEANISNLDASVAAIKTQTDKLNFNADVTPLLLVDVRDVNDTAVSSVDDFKADVSGLSTFDPTTDTVIVGTNNDKTGYSLATDQSAVTIGTVNALGTQAKSDVETAVWDAAVSSHTAPDSFGEEVQTHATSSEISALNDISAADVWNYTTRTLTSNANLNDPTAEEIADAVWDEERADHTTAGTFGEGVASVQSAVTIDGTSVDLIWNETQSEHTTEGTFGYYLDSRVSESGSSALTAAEIADAVWDEATSDHQSTGTTGKALTDAQSAGDPWATVLPGNYTDNQAGARFVSIQSTLDSVDDQIQAASSFATVVDTTTLKVTIRRGDDYTASSKNGRLNFTLSGYDLSSVQEIWFTVKRNRADADSNAVLALKYTEDDIALIDAANGKIAISLTAAQTAQLSPTTYYYDIQVKLNNTVSTPITGEFRVLADVTHTTS